MSVVKFVSSFRLASLLRRENDPSAAIKLFGNPDVLNPKRPFGYSLLCYDITIIKLGGSKMFEELDQVLLQLKNDIQIVPTETLFCNVIDYFCRGRLPISALHMFDEMPQYRCQRTVKSVNSLLSALLNCEWCFGDSLKLFDEMVKKKLKSVTFGTLIHALCKALKVKEALKMKHDMLKVYGVRPTVHIYASLIKALRHAGELGFAFKLKDEAYEGKIKVDSVIYSTLISSLIKNGRSNEVSTILEEMREKECKPDTVTYNVLINGFCVENDSESTNRVLDEMVEKGIKPDVISYNMILGVLCRIQKWKETTYMFEDMPRRGCSLDTLSYWIVFDGLCEGLQFEEAVVILHEMLFKGYKPRRDRLERFLQRLFESGKLEILSKVISSLHKGNADDADVWSVIIPIMCKEPVLSDSIDFLLNTEKEDGPSPAMQQC